MKHWLGILGCIFVGYLLQTTVLQSIQIGGVAPNLLIILLVVVSYRYGNLAGMVTGFFIGLLVDLVEGDIIGLNALIYLVMGYLLGLANRIYDDDDATLPLFFVAASDLACNFMFYMFGFLLRNRLHLLFYIKTIMLPEMLYTVVLSVFFYRLIHAFLRWLDKTRKVEEEG